MGQIKLFIRLPYYVQKMIDIELNFIRIVLELYY